MKLYIDKFLRFIKKYDKRSFETLYDKKEFLAELSSNGIIYIPKSTGKRRLHSFEYLNRIVRRFNQARSFRPVDYNIDQVRNASYTLSLIKEYLKRNKKIMPKTKFSDLENKSSIEGYLNDRKYLSTARNRPIVEKRKRLDDFRCQSCGFKLKINKHFIIECHHKIPFSSSQKKRVTRIEDLICLCPTCHRIAHIQKPPFSIEKIKNFLKRLNSK